MRGADDLYARQPVGRPAPAPDDPIAHDALLVLTALSMADRPMSWSDLADALCWNSKRLDAALDFAREHPNPASPVILRNVPPEHFTATARLDLLTAVQSTVLIAHHNVEERGYNPRPQRKPLTSTRPRCSWTSPATRGSRTATRTPPSSSTR